MPRRPAPPSLRPFLHFTRFPPPALDAARRALDDDAFRGRVVELADPDLVGEVAMLVLDRPDGWEDALAARVDAAATEAEAGAEAREVQRLTRQLERTAERLEASEARVAEVVAERDAAKGAREALRDELTAVRDELAAVREERSRAVRELKATEERARRRGQELTTARRTVQDLRARVDALEAAGGDERPPSPAATGGRTDGEVRAGPRPIDPPEVASDDRSTPAGRPAVGAGGDPEAAGPSVDLASVADAVAAASRAAADLATSLERAAGALRRPGDDADGTTAAGAAAPGGGEAPSSPGDHPAGPPVRPRRRHRRPTRLPGGVLDDTPEALLALARTPEMLLVVDGYNVAKTAWPDLPIATERERLIDGLADLQARTGVDVLVVFDGAEQPGPTSSSAAPRPIRVRFSPPDVEADDVIVALVADLPDQRPVTVVSSDRRVQRGAADGGANVAQAAQLVALLRR